MKWFSVEVIDRMNGITAWLRVNPDNITAVQGPWPPDTGGYLLILPNPHWIEVKEITPEILAWTESL